LDPADVFVLGSSEGPGFVLKEYDSALCNEILAACCALRESGRLSHQGGMGTASTRFVDASFRGDQTCWLTTEYQAALENTAESANNGMTQLFLNVHRLHAFLMESTGLAAAGFSFDRGVSVQLALYVSKFVT
jgi:hypothetical protein